MKMYWPGVAAWLVGMATCSADLINPGFETSGGVGWNYPGTWGTGGSWRDGGAGDAHSGANGATFDALTSLGGDAYYVLSQELAASEGQLWNVSAWQKAVNLGDQNSESWIEVQFRDAGSGVLAQYQSTHVNANLDWTEMTFSDLAAPASTVQISVRGVIYIHPGGTAQTEFHLFDDFQATSVPEPGSATLSFLGVALVIGIRTARKRLVA